MFKVQTNIKNQELVNKRRRQIIESSTKLFFEKGFDQTTMRDISRASGLTMGSLYDYIETKEDILFLVYTDLLDRVYEGINAAAGLENWTERPKDIAVLLRHHLEQMYGLTQAVQLLYRESWARGRKMHEQMRAIDQQYVEEFARLLENGNKAGVFKVEEPRIVANLIILTVALPAIREWGVYKIDREKLISNVVEFIIRGLSPFNGADK